MTSSAIGRASVASEAAHDRQNAAPSQGPIVLFAVGSSLAADVEESLLRSSREVRCVHNISGPHFVTSPTLDIAELNAELNAGWTECEHLVPLFTPGNRQQAVRGAVAAGFGRPARWLDATVPDSPSLRMAPGVYVGAGCVIGASSQFDEFVLVNRSASIGHHAHLEAFVSVGPAAVLAGHVRVGCGAVIGAGAVVLPKVSIGRNAVVAGGAVVNRDVPDHCLVAGNPAVIKKREIPGFQGLSVESADAA